MYSLPGIPDARWRRAALPRYCRSLRSMWARLKMQLRWLRGVNEISYQGLEYDEETGELRGFL